MPLVISAHQLLGGSPCGRYNPLAPLAHCAQPEQVLVTRAEGTQVLGAGTQESTLEQGG